MIHLDQPVATSRRYGKRIHSEAARSLRYRTYGERQDTRFEKLTAAVPYDVVKSKPTAKSGCSNASESLEKLDIA